MPCGPDMEVAARAERSETEVEDFESKLRRDDSGVGGGDVTAVAGNATDGCDELVAGVATDRCDEVVADVAPDRCDEVVAGDATDRCDDVVAAAWRLTDVSAHSPIFPTISCEFVGV